MKMFKSAQNVIFHAVLAIFGPYEPLRGLSEVQKSTFKGLYYPKSLCKLVPPENVSIFYLYNVEMLLNTEKLNLGEKSQNFNLKFSMKS